MHFHHQDLGEDFERTILVHLEDVAEDYYKAHLNNDSDRPSGESRRGRRTVAVDLGAVVREVDLEVDHLEAGDSEREDTIVKQAVAVLPPVEGSPGPPFDLS